MFNSKKYYQKNKKRIQKQQKKYNKQYRQNSKKKITEKNKKYYLKLKKTSKWTLAYYTAKTRCNNPNQKDYKYYGGRGIKFLMTVENFKYLWFRDKAYNMKQPSIDRKDNNGNYELNNCRFIELVENIKRGKTRIKEEIKKLKQQLARYKQLSLHDDLTGLFNRRKLKKDIKRYLEIKKRFGVDFTVMMLDINKFKKINDTTGHKEGDRILTKVAKVLRKSIRKYEKIYRISGDEFIIIFSHTKNISWAILRIRKNLAKIKIKVSIGIGDLHKNVLEIIDKRMYEDKRKIKNIICPYCKLAKLYIEKTNKEGNTIEAKCIICKEVVKIKDIRQK